MPPRSAQNKDAARLTSSGPADRNALVNGDKIGMVNGGLRPARAVAPPVHSCYLPESSRLRGRHGSRGPVEASSSQSKQFLIDSALRTLDAGSGGIAALASAMQDGL